jgi:hypothetical protein
MTDTTPTFATFSDYRRQPGYLDAPERPNTVTFNGHTIHAREIVHAWNAVSHFPEARAALAIQELGEAINRMAERVCSWTETSSSFDAEEEIARFSDGYLTKWRAYIGSQSRCISSFITGGSNFPARRAEKASRSSDKRWAELKDFVSRAEKAMRRKAYPYGDGSEIRSNDPEAVELLESEIASLKAKQEQMKAVNAAHRAYVKDPESKQAKSLIAALGKGYQILVRTYEAPYSWEPHPFPPYALSNNLANIKRLEKRLAELKRTKDVGSGSKTHNTTAGAVEVIENTDEMRIQMVFPGKPSLDVRATLKSNGFRWAPSQGAWQRHLNNNGRWAVERVISALQEDEAA